ncbi:MAG TPA: hypothetical protein VGL78_04215 [Solirubrobacteraceae bacterium]|jgi:hypothetical protein
MLEPVTTSEHHGVTVTIHRDPHPADPRREFDNLGTVVGWRHPRYCIGDQQLSADTRSSGEIVAELIEYDDARVILPIHFHEQEGDLSTSQPDDEAFENCDGVIYVTAARLRKRYRLQRLSKRAIGSATVCLVAEIAEYSAYLSGRVFGFVIEHNGEHLYSCWGFYQLDYCEARADEAADYEADRLVTEAAEANDWACRGGLTIDPFAK